VDLAIDHLDLAPGVGVFPSLKGLAVKQGSETVRGGFFSRIGGSESAGNKSGEKEWQCFHKFLFCRGGTYAVLEGLLSEMAMSADFSEVPRREEMNSPRRSPPTSRSTAIAGNSTVQLPRTSQNFRDEALFFENRKCLGFFTGPKESRWDSELVVDGHGDAAFSGAVEFGDDDAVERTGFVKFLGLLQRVGAGGGIHDEQGEMRCRLVLLGDGAAVEPKEMIRSEEESAVYGSSTSTASSFHAPSFPSSRVSIRISIGLDRDFDCGR
jgi:hypothetical protein